jgi:hypothetical protein
VEEYRRIKMAKRTVKETENREERDFSNAELAASVGTLGFAGPVIEAAGPSGKKLAHHVTLEDNQGNEGKGEGSDETSARTGAAVALTAAQDDDREKDE